MTIEPFEEGNPWPGAWQRVYDVGPGASLDITFDGSGPPEPDVDRIWTGWIHGKRGIISFEQATELDGWVTWIAEVVLRTRA